MNGDKKSKGGRETRHHKYKTVRYINIFLFPRKKYPDLGSQVKITVVHGESHIQS